MYNVRILTLAPALEAVDPLLALDVSVDLYGRNAFLVSLWGEVRCGGRRLAHLDRALGVEEQLTVSIDSQEPQTTAVALLAPLSARALAHIEREREASGSGDVLLEVHLQADVMEVRLGRRAVQSVKTNDGHTVLAVAPERSGSQQLATFDSNGQFGTLRRQRAQAEHRIASSQWVQTFAPAFGLGRFLLFEYPVIEPPPVAAEDGPFDALAARVRETTVHLGTMQAALAAGEWQQAIVASRTVAELLRAKDIQGAIAALLQRDTGTADGADALLGGMQALFTYASKFVHALDRTGGVQPQPQATREDAYLAFTMATATLNVLAAKLKRHAQTP